MANEMKVHCAHDKMIDALKLNPHPKNRNKHPDDQIKRLADILKYQGWRYPVKVSNQSGFVTSGHGRIEAAKFNGWKKVPVNYQDYENDEQEYADVQADNAIAAWSELDLSGINSDLEDLGPDFDIEMLGIENFVLEPAEKLEPQCDEDEIPEHVEPKTKLGDIYKLGNHRLMCGDSTSIDAVEKLMDGQKADMVFTDPPYGIGLDKEGQKLGKSQAYGAVLNDDSTSTAIDAFNLVTSLSIPAIFFWGANHYSQALDGSPCWIVWDKQGGKHVTYADVELCYTNLEAPARMFTHIWDGFRKQSEKGDKRVHPTQKPVKLIEEIWEFFESKVGASKAVLDLFGGSGSTLVACEKTDRKCFMMELGPTYCDVIVARWEKFTGKKAELINGET